MSGGGHASSASSPFGTRTLRQGMRGSRVTLLQFYLDVAGYRTGADGYFGRGTRKSVANFQRSWGLRATGVVRQADGRALAGKVQQIDSVKPSGRTRINRDGTATAASNAPPVVRWMIAGANRIIDSSYCYAGGHGQWKSSCYDCSGAVSYVLHAGYMLSQSEDSTGFESYGAPGKGKWVTIYAASGHAFMVIDGRAFDTADFGGPNRPSGTGPRWRSNPRGNLADGMSYVVRHPPGL
jgi:peptidoglycan hydrolase-like protein with peptidoglycan-binding domain